MNKKKDNSHLVTSIHTEKVFDKIQHPLIKTNKLEIEVNFLNLMKGIYDKLIANNMTDDKDGMFSPHDQEQDKNAPLPVIQEILASRGKS